MQGNSLAAEHITLIVLACVLFSSSLVCLLCAWKRNRDDKNREVAQQPFLASDQQRSDAV